MAKLQRNTGAMHSAPALSTNVHATRTESVQSSIMGFSRLFRSRWAALFWAAGIVWTAYDVASDSPEPAPKPGAKAIVGQDATGAEFDANDLAVLANIGN